MLALPREMSSSIGTLVGLEAALLHTVKVFVFADKVGVEEMKKETSEAL